MHSFFAALRRVESVQLSQVNKRSYSRRLLLLNCMKAEYVMVDKGSNHG